MPLQGQDTSGSFALMEQAGHRGAGSPMHRHTREAETFIVLDGELDGWSGSNHTVVSAGDILYLPPDEDHAFRVRSDTARFLVLITPAGLERFFLEDGTPTQSDAALPAPPGPPPPEAVEHLSQLAARYGVTVTGPPPTP
jgi:quercetin dioxygenase-like cupin family protein